MEIKMKFSKLNKPAKTSRLNGANSFKYGALDFTIKKQAENIYRLLYTSGPMKCEIFLNANPDEEGEINITLSDYIEWFDSPQLKSLTKLLDEVTDDDIVDVYKFAELAGIEVE